MSERLSVAVLISAGQHPVSRAPRACRGDAVAMALGRKLAGDSLRVVHAGDPKSPALNDYHALGASRIEVVAVPDGQDAIGPLAAKLLKADVILTGSRAEQGEGSGLLPYLLAHALRRPVIADVLGVWIEKGEAQVRQFQPKGRRRRVAAPVPLVLSVHPLASCELTYAYARLKSGRIELASVVAQPRQAIRPHWTLEPASQRPVPLKARDTKDGHARMLGYIQSQAKGGAVVFEGSSVDKAQILLTYLRDHRLVEL